MCTLSRGQGRIFFIWGVWWGALLVQKGDEGSFFRGREKCTFYPGRGRKTLTKRKRVYYLLDDIEKQRCRQ